MAQILRTVLIPDETQSADGVVSFDLPVNPLSAILLTVQALNDTAAIASYSALLALLNMITDVRVAYRGASVIQGNLADLAVMYACVSGWSPIQGNRVSTDNDVRSLTVPLLFGRKPYDPRECFPASRRGDLVLQLTTDIAVTGADGLSIQAETVELLDVVPEQFLKVTTTQKIHNAISEHDVELPIGNDLLGVLLRGAVVPTGAARTASFGSVALEVDNVETIYAESRWESMRADLARRIKWNEETPHFHGFTDAAAGATFTREQEESAAILNNYAYLDLDPLLDGQYALRTREAARVNLRVNSEVASATAQRILPVELVPVPKQPAA